MASITAVGFQAAYTEFSYIESGVLTQAVAVANALTLTLYTKAVEEQERRYIEVAANLFERPKGKSLVKNWAPVEANPYRQKLEKMDFDKASANRGISSWDLPTGVS